MTDPRNDWDEVRSDFRNVEPGRAEGSTPEYPSTGPDTSHAQRDNWVWDDETGWNPPKG